MRIWEALFGLMFLKRKQWDALVCAHPAHPPTRLPGECQELLAFMLSFYVPTKQPFTPPLGEVTSPQNLPRGLATP